MPLDLIQKYFPSFKSIHELRIHLLQSIDKTRSSRLQRGSSVISTCRVPVDELVVSNSKSVPHFSFHPQQNKTNDEYPVGRKPVTLFPPKKRPTTPKVILDILKKVEKKNPKTGESISSSIINELRTDSNRPSLSQRNGSFHLESNKKSLQFNLKSTLNKVGRAQSAPSALKRSAMPSEHQQQTASSRPASSRTRHTNRAISAGSRRQEQNITDNTLGPEDIIRQLSVRNHRTKQL